MNAPAAIKATFADWPIKRPPHGASLADRVLFRAMPEPMSGCWLWTASAAGGRYGSIKDRGRLIPAHRAAWTAFTGPIPEGLCVLHKCDNTFCVNPDHLFLGTQVDNAKDRERKGRGNQPSGERSGRHTKPWRTARGRTSGGYLGRNKRRGDANGRAVLTEEDARAIRASVTPSRQEARRYGVSKTTILKIRAGKLWTHL